MEKEIELLRCINRISSEYKKMRHNVSGRGKDFGMKGNGRILQKIVHNPGITQKELAKMLDIRPQSLTEVLGKLEEKGYIERKRSQEDRRVITLYITEAGKEKSAQLHDLRYKSAQRLFSSLDEKEIDELLVLLNKVIDNSKGGDND
ncbi:MAG: MarR family transcriptional regulator [Erysipelotrichaceae bacterium]|nr:MarR family transcriptional regulator [Erysipelotrichaceae bacterium]